MKLVLLLLAAFLLSESYAEFPEVCDKTSSWKCVMCVRTVKEVLDKKPKAMTEVVFPDCKKAENKVSKRAAKTCTDFAKHFKLKMTEVHLAEFDKSANQNALNVCKEMKCCSVASPMEGQKFKNVEPVLEGNLVRAENGWNTAFNFEMIDVCLTITLTLSSGATIASHSAITFPGYEITGLLDEAGKGCAAENKGVDGSKKRNHCVTCYDMLDSMKKMIKKGETLQRIVFAGARDWGFTRSGGGALSLKPYADDGEPALTGETGNHANLVEVAKFFGNAAATIVADFPERGGFRLLFLHDKIFRTQHKRVGYCKTVADASKDKVLVHEIQGDVAPINAAELKTQKHMIDNAVVNAVTVDPYTHRPAKEFVVLVVETVNAKGCYFVVAGKEKKIINSGASKVLRAVFM